MNLRNVLARPEYLPQKMIVFKDRIVFAELTTTSKEMFGEFTSTAAGILLPVEATEYKLGVVVATGYELREDDLTRVQIGDLIYYSPFAAGTLERPYTDPNTGENKVEIIETGSMMFKGHKYFHMRESQVLARQTMNGPQMFRDNVLVLPDPFVKQVGSIILSDDAEMVDDLVRTGTVIRFSSHWERYSGSTNVFLFGGERVAYNSTAGDPIEAYMPGAPPTQMVVLSEKEIIGIAE